MSHPSLPDLGALLGIVVHDLRNPSATISANVAYVKEVALEGRGGDLAEALADVEIALDDLMLGLEQVAWIGRWLQDKTAMEAPGGDVVATIEGLAPPGAELELVRTLPSGRLEARGGGAPLARMLRVLLANSAQHARTGQVHISARSVDAGVEVELRDRGPALASELRASAFTLAAQRELKGRADGRYGRVAGLFALGILGRSIGATVEADEADGTAVFRIRLAAPEA